jgi:hypothetical protein
VKFFLDTANLEELKTSANRGATTNPTLIANQGRPMEEQVKPICHHPLTGKGPDQFLKDYAKAFQEVPVAG